MSSKKPSDTRLQELAVNLVLGVLRSASTEKIRPMDWWSRAQSALHSGAAMAQGFGQMVSVMGRKLQIDTLNQHSANAVSSIASELGDEETFESFRYICERDALYIIAEAQALRAIQREEYESRSPRSGGAQPSKEKRHDTERLDEDLRQAGL